MTKELELYEFLIRKYMEQNKLVDTDLMNDRIMANNPTKLWLDQNKNLHDGHDAEDNLCAEWLKTVDPFYISKMLQKRKKMFGHCLSENKNLAKKLDNLDPISEFGLSYIYLLKGNLNEPLYVGKTFHLKSRIASHRATKDWFKDVVSISYEVYPDVHGQDLSRENFLIEIMKPKYNKSHQKSRKKKPMPPVGWSEKQDLALEFLEYAIEQDQHRVIKKQKS